MTGGRFRWKICALLFFATTVNYMDRLVFGILAPTLEKSIGWNEAQYGYIVTAFQAAYAIGLLFAGRFMDRVGVRVGYAASVLVWSLASMAHTLAHSALGFGFARFALGLGEAGNFPAALKTVAEWFPKKERALAIGLFNAGSNVGAIIAPLVVPVVALRLGWRWAFLFTGLADICWLVFWLAIYKRPSEHPRLSKEELAYIQSEPATPPVQISLRSLLAQRQTWAFALGKFLTDPIWWFYLFWLPKFLSQARGLSFMSLGLPLVVIYLAADGGSILGGGLSSFLMGRGWAANRARKFSLLVCALCVVPIVLAPLASNLWVAVALIGLATAAHQGWSANLFATASDMFPQTAIGSVVGIGGTAGAIGGMIIASLAGLILQLTGSYIPLFVIASSAYLVALVTLQALAPTLEPAVLEPLAA